MKRTLAAAGASAALLAVGAALGPPSADAAVCRGGVCVTTRNVVKTGPFLLAYADVRVQPGWRALAVLTLYRGADARRPAFPIAASPVRSVGVSRRVREFTLRVSSVCDPGSPGLWFGFTRVVAQKGTRGAVVRFGSRSSVSVRLSCGRV